MNPKSGANGAKSEPKEVLYAWNYLEWGGAQMYFLGLASRIVPEFSAKFIMPRGTSAQFLEFCAARGVSTEFLDAANDLSAATSVFEKLRRHWRKLRSEIALVRRIDKLRRPDTIVHVDLAPWQSLLAILWLVRRGPVFMTMHNALPQVGPLRRLIWRAKFAIASRLDRFTIFASNADAREGLREFVTPAFFDRVEVTYTNVDPDEIESTLASVPEKRRDFDRLGIPNGRFTVMCLGQFIDRKGRWVFLDAARSIAAKDDQINFVWISNSPLSAEDAARVASYNLADRFFLLKSENVASDHAGLLGFLRHADVFTLPSYVEGLPISLLEAMALGTASVSTSVYAIPEAVIDGETGLLVAPGDAGALAAAILRLKSDSSLRESVGRHGREHVLMNFNEKSVAEIAAAAYRRAVND